MSAHASMNRIYRLVWNEVLGAWVAVSEIAKGRGKRSVRAAVLLAPVLAALGLSLPVQAGPPAPVPAPTQLPVGGKVLAGSATIQPVAPGGAVLNIDQTTQRAAINWNSFNLGHAAQVNFNQPGKDASTLNRVLDTNPSQIFGKIMAPGQVILMNPNGVFFGKSASVDVGSLTATTHGISDTDYMAGKSSYERNGATGSVVNEGELRAALGGYIALLAPEVRNEGVIIANLGTVALAAGESFTLNFEGNNTLAGITVKPSAVHALVENKGAVLAPGGIIILSARALDRLQGGVVKNSGRLEATGMSFKGGRIVLEAS
ncbi:MAG: filamentous hemagglutinin N-terminal domain-containing protein, partial [Rhodoferax sp.]|nr:filamentous hemagglutinin N-terminal domain-containing protein [Rhodoferax sp.]